MRGREARVVGGVLLLAVILVAIAYAAITNVTLKINGTETIKLFIRVIEKKYTQTT